MFTRLASYLLGGVTEVDENSNNNGDETNKNEQTQTHIPMEPRLRQITIEGDDWILVERQNMDESWYVTPPACFTQPGPVHVETSPLEDLLIEHPSMSVYRSAGRPQDLPQKNSGAKNLKLLGSNKKSRPPLARRNDNGDNGNGNHHHLKKQQQNSAVEKRTNNNALAEGQRRPSGVRELRSARGDENVRIVQIRSAQKMMEKRTSQSSKRNILERGNKVYDVSTTKPRRPRRQDRLRINNSNANNNRKC